MNVGSEYNYYDILEVNEHCAQHEITVAYERARSTYGSYNPAIYTMFSADEARELLRMAEEAYSVLGNKTLRALYDEKIGRKTASIDVSYDALIAESKIAIHDAKKKVTSKSTFTPDLKMEESIKNISDWTGTELKKVREYKNLTIEKMSEITKISSYYIHSIETMNPDGLPAAVFVRGYTIQIARTLGLDDKKVADSYMKHFKVSLDKK